MYLRPNEYTKNPLYVLTRNMSLIKLTIHTENIDDKHRILGYTGHVEYSIVKHIVTRDMSGITDILHEGIENYEDTHGIWYLTSEEEKMITSSMRETVDFLNDHMEVFPLKKTNKWHEWDFLMMDENARPFQTRSQIDTLYQKCMQGPIHPVRKTPYKDGQYTVYPFAIYNGYEDEIARIWISNEGIINLMPYDDDGHVSIAYTAGDSDTASKDWCKDILADMEERQGRNDEPLWSDLTIKSKIEDLLNEDKIPVQSDEELAHMVDIFKENLKNAPRETEHERQSRILKATVAGIEEEYKEEEIEME